MFGSISDMVNEYVVNYIVRGNSKLCPVAMLQRYLNINTGDWERKMFHCLKQERENFSLPS